MKERRRYGFTSMVKGRIQQFTRLVLWCITVQIAILPFVESFNKSFNAVDIPTANSLSKRTLSWADAISKGSRLLCRLENPALLDDQSTVTSNSILKASGWVKFSEYTNNVYLSDIKDFLVQEGIAINPVDWIGTRIRHLRVSTNSQGQEVPPTGARYSNIYNPKEGIIVAYNNFGPAYMIRDDPIPILPDVKAWSDVVFVEWQSHTEVGGHDIKGLKYIVRYHIVNADTASIMAQAATTAATEPEWPGETIPMSDIRGKAILGTPNGVGIAYLLATHKAQLGHMTVDRVQMWTRHFTDPSGVYNYLYAVFTIGPVASSSTA